MEQMNLTHLRQHLYKVVDEVIATGNPQFLERKGYRLKIVLESSPKRLDRLTPHADVTDDPDSLAQLSVYEWHDDLPS